MKHEFVRVRLHGAHELGVVAHSESDLIGERVSGAWEQKRKRGEKTGGHVPYGYGLAGNGKALIPDPHEQAVIAKIQANGIRC